MHRLEEPAKRRVPLRLPSANMGPVRTGTHAVLGSGRFPNLSEWRSRWHDATGRGGGPRVRALRVFAVEPTAVQIDWAELGPGPVRFAVADTVVDIVADGGPGVVDLADLPTGVTLTVRVSGPGVATDRGPGGTIDLRVTTPHPPPGAELARIATFSDSHVGETTFGYLHTLGETDASNPPHPVRAVRAAVAESTAWGAERLVAKGDIVDQSHPGHWAEVFDALADAPGPVHLVPGNHEVKRRRSIDPGDALAGSDVHFTGGVDTVDLGGASLVLVNSSLPDHERGQFAPHAEAIQDALSDADGGVLLATHHHLRSGSSTIAWPVGIPRAEAAPVLDAIARNRPATMITSGHVHRNRLRRHGPLTLTCVGSVKDYPGVWAGYVFHEGGIRQVVRRVADPSVLAWTERTGDALGGLYRHWTPSTLAKRCVSITWPTSPR